MTIKNILLCLAALAAPLTAADQTLQLTPDNTKIGWTLADPLHTVKGTFKLKSGVIVFDSETGKASGSVVVDVKSGESGSGARDGRMHANVLESDKFPEAVFTPKSVEGKLAPQGASSLKLHGVFRIHGADHDMTMNVQAKLNGAQIDADIAFDIPYVSWGMKDPSNFLLKVGKTVQMNIHTATALK